MIREISIANFKSVQSLQLDLGRFNVLIGANGCGKSNILEAITFGAAAPIVQLTNEFLSTRGIRMTEPNLMQSAFETQDFKEGIKLYFSNDENETLYYSIDWRNEEWVLVPMMDMKKSNVYINRIREEASNYVHFQEKLTKYKAKFDDRKNVEQEFMKSILDTEAQKYVHDNNIANFLIFAPENYFLRNNVEENQIKPLGIRGEGLFRHIAAIGFKDPSVFDAIKENLRLIEWFDDLEFDITSDGYFTGRIKIKDAYLNGVQYFDQRSANEGFLYLLFYLTLFISKETPKFFAIDNIDNALNPKLAADLMPILARLAEKHGKQVIFTTHNPAILDGLNLNDPEQRLFVISRNAIGHTKALRIEKKPMSSNGQSYKLSEQFLRGYIGGLNF